MPTPSVGALDYPLPMYCFRGPKSSAATNVILNVKW